MFPLPERKARPISETVRLEVSVPQTSYWKEAVAQQSSSWMHFFNTEFPLELKADSNFHVRTDGEGWRKRRCTASLNEPVSELVAKCFRNGESFRRVLLEPGPNPSTESESGIPANNNAPAGSDLLNAGCMVTIQKATVGPSLEVAAVSGPKSTPVVRQEAPVVHSQAARAVPEQKCLLNTNDEAPAVPRQESPAVAAQEAPAEAAQKVPAVHSQDGLVVIKQEAPVELSPQPAVVARPQPQVVCFPLAPAGPSHNTTEADPSSGRMPSPAVHSEDGLVVIKQEAPVELSPQPAVVARPQPQVVCFPLAPAGPSHNTTEADSSSGRMPSPAGPIQNPTVVGPSCGEMPVPRSSQRGGRAGASERGIKGRAILNLVMMDDSIVERARTEFARTKRTGERNGSDTHPMVDKLLSDLLDQ